MTDKDGYTIRSGDWVYPVLTPADYAVPRQVQIVEHNGVLMLGKRPLSDYHTSGEFHAVIKISKTPP